MRLALEMFMTPVIGIVCFAIILLSWFGGVRYYRGIPAGLVAIAAGSLMAWGSTAVGLDYGIISVMVALIPVVAISPILLYIGMLIWAQAFQETPKSHASAIVLALTPHLAAWGKLQINRV